MAKFTLTIEDLSCSETVVKLDIDKVGSMSDLQKNTPTQNAAISIAIHLKSEGFEVSIPGIKVSNKN